MKIISLGVNQIKSVRGRGSCLCSTFHSNNVVSMIEGSASINSCFDACCLTGYQRYQYSEQHHRSPDINNCYPERAIAFDGIPFVYDQDAP